MKRTLRILRVTILLICLLQIFSPLWGESVRGVAFQDLNGNNTREFEEPGVPGVLVSNGLDVTVTDAHGRYELNLSGDAVIFITKPDGYDVPLSEQNLPLFYYIHRPTGSPPQKYKGVAPTGPIPASIDFPLLKTESRSEFQAIVFADPQPRNLKQLSYVRDDVVAELVGSSAAFGVVLGDILFDNLSFYDDYKEVISKVGIPFYHVPGNHDTNQDSPDDQYSMETYIRHFGPPYYSFDFGQVHFVVLDNIEWIGPRGGQRGRYNAKLGEKQLAWLKNNLKHVDHSKLAVICSHIPIINIRHPKPHSIMKDAGDLFKILEDRKNLLFLAGHTHTQTHHYINQEDGWKGANPIHQIICGTVSGCWWNGPKDVEDIPVADMSDGTPNGYHIFHFKGNGYSGKFIPARSGDDFQMRFSSPKREIFREEIPENPIIVNIFNGSEKSIVECRVNNSDTVEMTRVIRTDPYIEKLIADHKNSFGATFKARPCFHIWSAPLPTHLKEGLHVITIKTTDQYGQNFQASRIFEIE